MSSAKAIIAVLAACVLPAAIASDTSSEQDVIVLLDQQRSVTADTDVYYMDGSCHDSDSDSAPDLDPFSSEVSSSCGGGESSASQHSWMGQRGFVASGRVSASAYGDDSCGQGGWEEFSDATSRFVVQFGLQAPVEMTCRFYVGPVDGTLEARLEGPGDTIHFAPGERRTETFLAGVYDLVVDLHAHAFNKCPNGVPGYVTEAFDYAFRLEPCAEDLDGSGAVDFGDLLAVLDTWGACGNCNEDLDVDGSVDMDDLLFVLTKWGPC